ncbi:MAG: DNA-processing protein DprA, partial [Litoreibacter sp.]
VAINSPGYPVLLDEIPNPPPILWCVGNLDLLNKNPLAIVGARNASSLGTRMAKRLSRDLGAADFTIVSGLARGVDTAAHLAALDTGTIAVMAGGVDVIYPRENTVLAQEIEGKGLLVSEMPVGTVPQARHFPNRNRIISGLARTTIVVEAAAKSGSLITARTALDQGRDVQAVPGHPFDARASGCNMLIRDGATLVRSAQDVIDALEQPARATPKAQKAKPKAPAIPHDIAALHAQILDRLGPSPIAEDQLIRDLSVPASAVSPEISMLELEGKIQRQPGGLLSRAVDA